MFYVVRDFSELRSSATIGVLAFIGPSQSHGLPPPRSAHAIDADKTRVEFPAAVSRRESFFHSRRDCIRREGRRGACSVPGIDAGVGQLQKVEGPNIPHPMLRRPGLRENDKEAAPTLLWPHQDGQQMPQEGLARLPQTTTVPSLVTNCLPSNNFSWIFPF